LTGVQQVFIRPLFGFIGKGFVMNTTLQPQGWLAPRGYANGVSTNVVDGQVISVAGQIGWNAQCQFESDDFGEQTKLALENIMAVLRCAGAGPEHIVRMTWYVTDKKEYLAAGKVIGGHYKSLMRDSTGKVHYPAMSAVQVTALMEDKAKVEIEVTAIKSNLNQ
jgi:enamine deaminase RidA (YjgF/YER057c/UK114 family)